MNISKDITITSVFLETKHIEVYKDLDNTPWSYEVKELLSKKVMTPRQYIELKDELEDLSWKENFVFEIHDGWGNLES